MFYNKELQAIKNAARYRAREIFSENILDFASNDYLGLSYKKSLLKKSFKRVSCYKNHAPKSSALVNGYHTVHKDFEEYIAKINNFSKAICVGSGFLANLSIFEALPRRGDLLIFDEEFHASGMIVTNMSKAEVQTFKHNYMQDLKEKIGTFKKTYKGRVIIAVEGIYSMSGDMVKKEIFEIADEYNALIVVDEAHSVGVIGDNLLGVFEHYKIKPKENHIKMGTLGKAIGSYGAYILCSNEIHEYLCNRSKAIIYTTAPSLLDISLAHEGFLYIKENKNKIKNKIAERKSLIKKYFDTDLQGLILPINVKSSVNAIEIKENLIKKGFLVGAIRAPTVPKPILRVIARINEKGFKKLLQLIKQEISK